MPYGDGNRGQFWGTTLRFFPGVEGEGRFIGTHVGVIVNQQNTGWWEKES